MAKAISVDPLQRYLQQQRSDGQVDSSGDFTLVWAKAREKLRQFQLESPAHYVLKLVQAAVGAGTDRVDFKIGARELICYFKLPPESQDFGLKAVSQALSQPPASESPLRNLVIGLNASFMSEPTEVLWGLWSGQIGEAIRFGRENSELLQDLPHPQPDGMREGESFCYFRCARTPSLTSLVSAKEHALLTDRCGHSPVPIFVDSKMVESRTPCLKSGGVDRRVTQNYFLLRYLKGVQDGRVGISTGDPALWTDGVPFRRYENPTFDVLKHSPYLLALEPRTALEKDARRILCEAAVSLPVQMGGPCRLRLVRFGVTMDPLVLANFSFGSEVVMDGEKLKVDISEFSLVENVELEALRTEAKKLLREVGGSLLKITDLPAFPVDSAETQLAKAACCCFLGWFGIFLAMWEFYRSRTAKAKFSSMVDQAVRGRAFTMSRTR